MNTPHEITFREAVQLEEQARGDHSYSIPEIADAVEANYPAAVAEFTRTSRQAAIRRGVKAIIAPPASQQPSLPGFGDLPLRISLPAEGGDFIYKSTRSATSDDFAAHLKILDDGIKSDQRRRVMYVNAVEKVSELLTVHGVGCIADLPIELQQ